VPQDPADIQRQVENTRAELAATIDAIAEIVSPKRVADRATARVKATVARAGQVVRWDHVGLVGGLAVVVVVVALRRHSKSG
jgi:hypothetical protein